MTGYPLVEDLNPPSTPISDADDAPERERRPPPDRGWHRFVLLGLIFLVHALLVVPMCGGWAGLTGPWPLPQNDHPMHYHNAFVTRAFLAQSGTTAGYDPSFMAGYAKSAVSDASNAAIELFVAFFGGRSPARAYKAFVAGSVAVLPVLACLAILVLGGKSDAALMGTALFTAYIWVDFPLWYANFGMVTFLLVVPLGALVVAVVCRFLERGGLGGWLLATMGLTSLALVHPLSALTAGPAIGLAIVGALLPGRRSGRRRPIGRLFALAAIPPIALLCVACWWLPVPELRETFSTRGQTFFNHSNEPVWERLAQIVGLGKPEQPVIQMILIGGSVVGLPVLWRSSRARALALGGFLVAGFFWGYLAGYSKRFDTLQPGRNTYAFYTGGAIAAGFAWSAIRARLREGPGRLDRLVAAGLLIVGVRIFVPGMVAAVRQRAGIDPMPSRIEGPDGERHWSIFGPSGKPPQIDGRPTPYLLWLVDRVRGTFGPGDRIFYEEGGIARPGIVDVYGGQRCGGLLPSLTGVEVIGGPFLEVPVVTNYAQFGMGQLFGREDWGREDFVRYAEVYRPSGIVCWSEAARAFCQANPDLVEVLDRRDVFLIGRVRGFGGGAVRGDAAVEAEPGRLTVRPGPAGVDGPVVLRYHTVPGLAAEPPTAIRPVELGEDPVPFIGLERPSGPVAIRWSDPL